MAAVQGAAAIFMSFISSSVNLLSFYFQKPADANSTQGRI